jgi:hypothetical protein
MRNPIENVIPNRVLKMKKGGRSTDSSISVKYSRGNELTQKKKQNGLPSADVTTTHTQKRDLNEMSKEKNVLLYVIYLK